MPNVPFFRDWYESKFSELCKEHDESYDAGECKLCSDYRLSLQITKKGYALVGVLTFVGVNMPWVWYEFLKNKKEI